MIDWGYWADKASEFRNAQKYDEAIECYEKILEDDPKDDFALTMIGTCFSESGRFDKALTYVNKALDVQPRDYFLWYNKAMVYFRNYNYHEAIKYFDEAISLKKDYAVSWYFKGWCYYYLTDIPKAIECFEISYNNDPDVDTRNLINDLKKKIPNTNTNHTSSSSMKECPNCGRKLNASAFNCGFCGYNFARNSRAGANRNSNSGMKECPNCGVMLRKNKKICPKCNYNFKKSRIDEPKTDVHNVNKSKTTAPKANNTKTDVHKVNKSKTNNPKTNVSNVNKSKNNKPISTKHFDNGIVSFDYPNSYSKDFNSKYRELGIFASFKIGSGNNFESAFAVFEGESISDNIPDSKFKEVIKKSLDADVLDINRYVFEEKERIIIKTQNKSMGYIEYHCSVPEIGFYILFVIPRGNEYLFNEEYASTVVNSLGKSTGESIVEENISTGVSSSQKSIAKSVPKEVKTCPNCNTENPNDSIFCMECGMKLDISDNVNFCIHCGTEVVPGAKFCMNCGKLIEY